MDIFKDGIKKGGSILVVLGALAVCIYETENRTQVIEKKIDTISVTLAEIKVQINDENKFSLNLRR